MLIDKQFKQYWDDMPTINSYEDSVYNHEFAFTKTFERKGFSWSVYCESNDMRSFADYPLFSHPYDLLKRRCPFVKRKIFYDKVDFYFNTSLNEQVLPTLKFIRSQTDYDEGLIWRHLVRTCNIADIHCKSNLNYILQKYSYEDDNIPKIKKVAVIAHIFYRDIIEIIFKYLRMIPNYVDIYCTVSSDDCIFAVKQELSKISNKSEIIRVENRGRDVSALLVGCGRLLEEYDYIAFVHDKSSPQLPKGIGKSWGHYLFENTIGSGEYVKNVIKLFEEEPYLGMLFPAFYANVWAGIKFDSEWDGLKDRVDGLSRQIGIKFNPHSFTGECLFPCGAVFWFRTAAVKKIFKNGGKCWNYTDFPKEPLKSNKEVNHMIERIWAYVVADAGYYSGWIMSDEYMRSSLTYYHYGIRNLWFKVNLLEGTHPIMGENSKETLNAVYNSTSWKITRPIRLIGRILRQFKLMRR